MQQFDPDAYLANATAAGFNPDAYLAAAKPPRIGEALGLYEGFMHPFDRAAVALSKSAGSIPVVGPAIDAAGKAMGMPGAEEAAAGHEAFVEQQRKAGIEPGAVGEFGGNVLATMPVAALAGPATGGAVIGGLLSDSDSIGGTVADMLKGAAAGKVGDVVFRGLAAGSKPVTRYIANKVQDWTQPVQSSVRDAAQYVYRLMGDSTPADIRQAAIEAGDKPIIGAEAIGRPGVTALAALGRRSGATADPLAALLSERAAGTGDRILGDFAEMSGIEPEAAKGNFDEVVKAARQDATPLYEKAFSYPGATSARLERFAQEPIIQEGMRTGLKIQRLNALAKNEPFDPAAYAITDFNEAGDPIVGKVPNWRTWDAAKVGLDNMLEAYRNPITGKLDLTRMGGAINDVRKALIKELDEANPLYKDARSSAADYLSARDAFDQGGRMVLSPNVTVRQMADAIGGMSDANAMAFKAGIANRFFNEAQNGRLAPNMFERPILQQKLVAAMGADDASVFLRNMKTELKMKQSGARMMPGTGSITSDVMNATGEQNASADALMDAIYAGAHLAYGNKIGFGTRMLSAMRRLNPRGAMMPEATRNEAGRLLMMNPTDLADHLESMQVMPPSIGRVANVIGAGRVPARLAAPALAVTQNQGVAP